MPTHSNEDTRPMRLVWLPGIAIGALCALIVCPQTHNVVTRQLLFAIPTNRSIAAGSPFGYTDAAVADYASPVVRRCANEHADDLSQQIAAATSLPSDLSESRTNQPAGFPPVNSSIKITRLQSLIPRFEDQPALYAAILRFKTQGKVRVTREEVSQFLPDTEAAASASTHHASVVHSRQADVEEYNEECSAAERLDPDNGFFPTMHAIGLFEASRDAEALAALERAAACSQWQEYLDDEFDGEVTLQSEAFGASGPLPRATFAAAILLPHLASIRAAAKLALFEAVQAEQSGHILDGLSIRTSIRRVGSLLRCDSRNLIGSVVGMSLVKMSLMRPMGAHAGPKTDVFTQKAARDVLLKSFDSYLNSAGSESDTESVHAEVDACVKTRAIISTGLGTTVFETDIFNVLGLSLADMITLSIVVWLAGLGVVICLLAAAAKSKGVRKLPLVGRFGFMTVLAFAAGTAMIWLLLKQSMGSVGVVAHLGENWLNSEDGKPSGHNLLQIICQGYPGIIATIPALTVMILAALCLIWRAPVLAGIGRGVRGSFVPLCSVLVIGYTVLAPITAAYENRLDMRLTEAFKHEGRATARQVGVDWPGIVR